MTDNNQDPALDKEKPAEVEGDAPEKTEAVTAITPELPPVAGPENVTVGDADVQALTESVEPQVTSDVTKPKYAAEATQQTEYPVHEVFIATDRVITDPTSAAAVQVPDAGRSPLSLPIYDLANGTPEERLAADAGATDGGSLSEEEREQHLASGGSLATLR